MVNNRVNNSSCSHPFLRNKPCRMSYFVFASIARCILRLSNTRHTCRAYSDLLTESERVREADVLYSVITVVVDYVLLSVKGPTPSPTLPVFQRPVSREGGGDREMEIGCYWACLFGPVSHTNSNTQQKWSNIPPT
jgi:hypothetical protein